MSALVRTFKALIGLFFDDGILALTLVALLAAIALLARWGAVQSPLAMIAMLVGGTLLLLVENVVRTARRRTTGR